MMTFGSLFSGIGGIDLGFERSGMECRWQVEIDQFCNRVLARHWPNVRRYGDIKEIEVAGLERVYVVAGGYPCQPFSCAGKRAGHDDHRYLWPEMLRVVRAVRPTWVVGENVAGHISMGLDAVLADLEAEGYACRTFVLPAAGVGAPHLRHRVFVVACSNRNALRIEHRWRGRQDREGAAVSPFDGQAQPLADADRRRREVVLQCNSDQAQDASDGCPCRDNADGCSANMADANSAARRQARSAWPTDGADEKRESPPKLGGFDCRGGVGGGDAWRPTESDLGRSAHGVSAWLDGTWERGISRTTASTAPKGDRAGRAHRLRALGNAVVPQVAEVIGRAIVAATGGGEVRA